MLLAWGMDAFTEANERNRMKLTKEELVETLKSNICKVTFTKLNGEVREMPCTLKEDIVPVYERKTPLKEAVTTEESKPNTTLSVWCMDKKEWRSFRVENVTKVEIELAIPVSA
jgi:hypothetical protein